MQFFSDFKIFLEISIGAIHLTITWYAVFILSGAILAFVLARRKAIQHGYKPEMLEDFFFTMLPIAFIGARIYYCIFEWEAQGYGENLIRVFYIWEGGLAIHGGLIAAILYAFYFFYRRGINVLRIGDCIMPYVLIAQIIGRWGNFMNQEAYGEIVSESYFQAFPTFIKEHMFIGGFYRQPMFLYEGIGNIIGLLLILTVFKKFLYKKRGDMIYAYVAWYGIVRFFVEMFRTDALLFMGLKVAQCISILFIVVGVLGYFGVYNKIFKKWYPFRQEKPTILFDADGTLLETKQLIFDSFRHTFKKYKPDYTLSEEELHSFFGPTLKVTFEKYFPQEQVEEIIEYYREFNYEHHDDYVVEKPHAKELVDYLKAEGYHIGVVSNKHSDLVEKGLVCANINEQMEIVVGYNHITHPKPNPEGLLYALEKMGCPVDDVIYVGDAPGDILAARNMGAYSIALVDEDNKESIAVVKPCRVIYDLEEIKDILKEDQEWNEIVM